MIKPTIDRYDPGGIDRQIGDERPNLFAGNDESCLHKVFDDNTSQYRLNGWGGKARMVCWLVG